ncbi:hypothetical protein Ocin01_20226 [Orchesella cincta]|uniref:Protein quiver n=1 Tax=Orchesella cincta TaxID=48709 RepID=A0A1D2M0G9_ORCCI|nr:hypothetical protein Ocin01_20226 [Orchesella cincta]
MQCSRLMMLVVLLLVLLSSLEIQLAEGIKCYSCRGCMGKGEEKDCGEKYDRCGEVKQWMALSNMTRTFRFCSDKASEDHVRRLDLTCDVFRPVVNGSTTLSRQCFCSADLCNDVLTDIEMTTTGSANAASLITEYPTLLQLCAPPSHVSPHSFSNDVVSPHLSPVIIVPNML